MSHSQSFREIASIVIVVAVGDRRHFGELDCVGRSLTCLNCQEVVVADIILPGRRSKRGADESTSTVVWNCSLLYMVFSDKALSIYKEMMTTWLSPSIHFN